MKGDGLNLKKNNLKLGFQVMASSLIYRICKISDTVDYVTVQKFCDTFRLLCDCPYHALSHFTDAPLELCQAVNCFPSSPSTSFCFLLQQFFIRITEWHGTENMGPEPHRAKISELHSVRYCQVQTVLRTVPFHLNRTPYHSVKFPSSKKLT